MFAESGCQLYLNHYKLVGAVKSAALKLVMANVDSIFLAEICQ